jgi:uncharacterized protein (DUF2267 family)
LKRAVAWSDREEKVKYDEFIKHVQSFAQLDSREEAERATRATLEVLREPLVGDEASQLAAQLPKELGHYLRGREGQNGQHFPLEDFIRQVSDQEGVEPTAAAMHVRAVFAVLQQAVTPGEYADVQANFSDDYKDLFAVHSGI